MFKPTQQDINFILENYMSKSSIEIANILGCSSSYVCKIGRTVSGGNKKRYTYRCNERYFENIDTYEKAYWLGFIMADGCIYKRKSNTNSQKMIKITLSKNDYNHLEKFKKAIDSTHKIGSVTRKSDNRNYSHITIVSDIMANDLSKYRCTENKTGNVSFPYFDNDELSWGFINGYIDGDGSISKIKDKNVFRYKVSIVGNKEILIGIKNFLNKKGVIMTMRKDNRTYSFDFYEIYCERMEYLNIIFKNTYNKNIVFLDRKADRVKDYYENKYDEVKEYYNIRHPL